jgi:hypothetical protein
VAAKLGELIKHETDIAQQIDSNEETSSVLHDSASQLKDPINGPSLSKNARKLSVLVTFFVTKALSAARSSDMAGNSVMQSMAATR